MKLPKPIGRYGYTSKQIKSICKKLKICEDTFWDSFGRNTITCDGDEYNYYPCDVETTLYNITKGKVGKDNGWD